MRFGILGPLAVRDGDTAVDIRRGIPRTLLIALLLRPGKTVSAGTLIDVLWDDAQPRNPANALQIQVSYLRRVLGGAGEGGTRRIVTRPGGYAIELAPDELDAQEFDRLVREAAACLPSAEGSNLRAALQLLDRALGLWRGDALEDVAGEPFAIGETTRLEESRWAAVEVRNDVLLALGRHAGLVGELGQLVDRLPLRERLHEQLLLALYRSGRQADALRAYAHARSVLVDELGLEPGTRLQELEQAVLLHDGSLDWRPPADDAPAKPAPAPPPAVTTGTVPAPVAILVGRETELSSVRHLLTRARILTLTGPPGAGKSRLALELAHVEAEAGPVWFVDLASVTGDDRVAAAASSALGVPSAPDGDTVAAVTGVLAIERGLLLLDTCEHVLLGAAELASRVLRQCPGMRVLATSRRPLGISGEIAWPVPPLALPPPRSTSRDAIATFAAVELFCQRAEAVRPTFALTDGNAADVAAICLALDGLPLALELAAARADVLTPAAILARLQNRFDLLVEGGRDVAARQQTLRAALDWSYELLATDQRRFFARLGVFAGSFGLDAAVTVAGDGFADPLTLLSALVRHSLVSVAGDDRYRLLDSVRAYAVELLGDEEGETRDRHAGYYTHLAEVGEQKIVGPDQVDWLRDMRADVANFRAALEWSFAGGQYELAVRLAGALGWFWTLEGMLDEAMDYLERAVAHTEVPPLVRAKALYGAALLAASLGHLERARRAGADSAETARVAGDPVLRARGLNAFAVAAWAQGDLGMAARAHDEAISLLEATGDLWGLGVCLALRARTALDAGDPEGERLARAALPVARASGDRHVIGIALEQLAQLDLAAGRTEPAREAAAECLALHQAVGYTEGIVAALHVLARSRAAGGDAKEARLLHLRALSLATRIGHTAGMCEALEGLAVLAAADGDFQEAVCLLDAAHRERQVAQLPLRAPDRRAMDELRRVAERMTGSETAAPPPTANRADSTDAVVARLLTGVPEPGR
ncbi:MAG: winged helix-turn-helix domain-containing protein [Actinomycetota bacterium]|nr:winged helix-turn-helix domain-containing protein [Actinomycetota bacterium]